MTPVPFHCAWGGNWFPYAPGCATDTCSAVLQVSSPLSVDTLQVIFLFSEVALDNEAVSIATRPGPWQRMDVNATDNCKLDGLILLYTPVATTVKFSVEQSKSGVIYFFMNSFSSY